MSVRTATRRHFRFHPFVLFLVLPFGAMIVALSNARKPWAKNIIWLFSGFMGLTMIMPDLEADHDLNRYRAAFSNAVESAHLPFWDVFVSNYTHGRHSDADLYANLLTNSIARVIPEFDVFLVVVGLVFGFFYSRVVMFAIERIEGSVTLVQVIFFVLGLLLIPIWAINGYRFATAALVFTYGVLCFADNSKKKGLFFVALSPMFHFSMWFCVIAYLLSFIVGSRFNVIFFFLVLSIVGSSINPDSVFKNAEILPIVFQAKVKGYSSADYIDKVAGDHGGAVWYVKGHVTALKGVFYVCLIYLFFKRKVLLSSLSPAYIHLLCFGVLVFALTNFISVIPSSGRFHSISMLILSAVFVAIFGRYSNMKSLNVIRILVPPLFLLFFVVRVRIGMEEIGLNTLLLNPFTAPFALDSPVLIDFLK